MNTSPVLRTTAFAGIVLLFALSVACSSAVPTATQYLTAKPEPTFTPVKEAALESLHCISGGWAKAWIDENENGEWDDDEQPLQGVRFWLKGTRNGNTIAFFEVASANQAGAAHIVSEGECDGTEVIEIYAEAPKGFQFTTPDRLDDAPSGGTFLFGFTFIGIPTPNSTQAALIREELTQMFAQRMCTSEVTVVHLESIIQASNPFSQPGPETVSQIWNCWQRQLVEAEGALNDLPSLCGPPSVCRAFAFDSVTLDAANATVCTGDTTEVKCYGWQLRKENDQWKASRGM